MATTPSLNFVLLYVSDIEASERYFTEVIGLRPAPNALPTFRGFLNEDDTPMPFGLGLVDPTVNPEPRKVGEVEVYFTTANPEALHQELTASGQQPTSVTPRPFGTIFSIPAPDEHLITMLKPPVR